MSDSDSDVDYLSDSTPDPNVDHGDLRRLGSMLGVPAVSACSEQRTIACMRIDGVDDIRDLEDKIRQTLKCDSGACAALDCSAYTELRLKLLRRLRGAFVTGHASVHVTATILLIADLEAREVAIVERQNHAPYAQPKPQRGKKKVY